MRWFIAGANGMLGQDLCEVLEAAGHDVTRRDLPELDILDAAQCLEQVAGHDVVANCAAHTAVDKAEEEEGLAFAINAVGAANLARAAAATGASMVQISTDKAVHPGNVMGATKRLAEMYCQALDLASPTHEYDAPGTYTITVKVVDVFGIDATKQLEVTV